MRDREESPYLKVQRMNVGEKVRVATVGPEELRKVLLNDPNKQVQMALITSPMVTDRDVLVLSSKPTVDAEVLRYIARKRDWMRKYQIIYNLVNNPKTPIDISLRYIPRLNFQHIKNISMNKSLPSQLSQKAKKLVELYKKGRK